MINAKSDKEQIMTAIGDVVREMSCWAASRSNQQFNTVPYEGSWTPGQLVRHVSKSVKGMANAMTMPSEPAQRDPAQRVSELQGIFLNFDSKLQSPDMVLPEAGPYDPQESSHKLYAAYERLKTNIDQTNLTDEVSGLPFGPITKLEILHFVLYHTTRHIHQMKKMDHALA